MAAKSNEKVRIDRYERRGSGTVDKEKVKEIVGLLSNKKDFMIGKPSKFKTSDKIDDAKSCAEIPKKEEEPKEPSLKKLTQESEPDE